MDNFLSSIKINKNEKKEAMSTVIFNMIHSSKVLSLNELIEGREELLNKLNTDELYVTYSLAKKIKISIMNYRFNQELFEYLELKLHSLNADKLLIFVNKAIEDMHEVTNRNPNSKWSLQVGKILLRINSTNQHDDEINEGSSQKRSTNKKTEKSNKIIKFPSR